MIKGQQVKAECLEMSPLVYYYGETCQSSAGDKQRQGLGIQLVFRETSDGDRQLHCRYEGEWKADQMHGEGRLDMGEEYYEGEFYEGQANGQGTYKFANGDFYSGSFTDGELNGEGSYFTMKSECTEGIFSKGFVMTDGVPLPPYLPEAEREAMFGRLYQGTAVSRQTNEMPDAIKISSSDRLVEALYEAMKLRRTVLLLRSMDFEGDLESILKSLDQKKADYQLYSLESLVDKPTKHHMLYGVKEAMEFGQQVIINLDYKLASKPKEFLSSHVTLKDCLSTKFINRDSQEILREFMLAGVPEPMYMHHEFLITLAGAMRVDLNQDYKSKLQRTYKFAKEVSRLQVLVVEALAKQTPFYQTEFMEESVNFDNIGGRPLDMLNNDDVQE